MADQQAAVIERIAAFCSAWYEAHGIERDPVDWYQAPQAPGSREPDPRGKGRTRSVACPAESPRRGPVNRA